MFENLSKTILCLYDYTGVFSEVYRKAGYNVVQIDIAKNGKDVRLLKKLNADVYGIIAMPPCTCFTKAGAHVKRDDKEMIDALSMVDVIFRLVYIYRKTLKFWVIENPPGKLKNYIGDYKTIVNYKNCGADFSKDACLFGDFNFPYLPERKGYFPGVDILFGSSESGKKNRSATPLEFAEMFFRFNT